MALKESNEGEFWGIATYPSVRQDGPSTHSNHSAPLPPLALPPRELSEGLSLCSQQGARSQSWLLST